MTGCPRAIAERDKLNEAAVGCPPLAYNLHLRGPRCSRLPGGTRICGACLADVRPGDFIVPQNASAERFERATALFPGKRSIASSMAENRASGQKNGVSVDFAKLANFSHKTGD